MEIIRPVLTVLILTVPNLSEAVTYTYTGTNYGSTSYNNRDDDPENYTLRGPYTENMNLSISFTVDTYLAPDTTYWLQGGALTPQGGIDSGAPIELREYRAFDGINLHDKRDLDVVTDSSGNIVEWWVSGANGCAPDCNRFWSQYEAGVFQEDAAYRYEYYYLDADKCGVGIGCIGTEQTQAFASEFGYWSVPVPASLPLLMAGISGIGFFARHRKNKAA